MNEIIRKTKKIQEKSKPDDYGIYLGKRLANIVERLKALPFRDRKRFLARAYLIIDELRLECPDFDECHELEKWISEVHIKETVKEVINKYALQGKKVTQKDFYRICEKEEIEILNPAKHLKTKFGYYFTVDERAIIVLGAGKKGIERLIEQFYFLGIHFLNKGDLLDINAALKILDNQARDRQKENADLFCKLILNLETEGK